MRTLALTLLFGFLAAWASSGLELGGIDEFDIVVEKLPAEVLRSGLSEPGLRSTIDSGLKSAGISPGDPSSETFLYLKAVVMEVGAWPLKPSGYIYRIDLDLRQPAVLISNPGIIGQATSWHDGCLGATAHSPPQLRKVITTTVQQYVNEFAQDYLAANPTR